MSKGISPMISAILLIAIAVASWALVSGWTKELSSEQTGLIENQTETELRCSRSAMYIDSATINCSSDCSAGVNHSIIAWIKNSGEIPIRLDKISIIDSTGDLTELNLNETKILSTGDYINITNISSASCSSFNSSSLLDELIVSSKNCPSDAYDKIEGSEITFQNC